MHLTPHVASYVAAIFCAAVSVFFLVNFFLRQRSRSDFRLVSSEWKGLGGGMGGLRVSTPFGFALLALFFAFLTVFIVSQQSAADHERTNSEFELQKLRESETRKYEDAKQAREADLEKARLAATAAANATPAGKKISSQPAEPK